MTHIHSIKTHGPIPPPPQGHTWETLMEHALQQAHKARSVGEIPVGAIVVTATGKIVAKAHNACVTRNDPTAHAEILALRAAGKALGNYRLKGATLVVTLEPCLMCAGALVHARVDGLVYGAADRQAGAIVSRMDGLDYAFLNHKVWHMGGVCADACGSILKEFFR